ncbi:MAG: pepsin/retropepsin-like aspartic protease family protein [Planctomycetota bacterium]
MIGASRARLVTPESRHRSITLERGRAETGRASTLACLILLVVGCGDSRSRRADPLPLDLSVVRSAARRALGQSAFDRIQHGVALEGTVTGYLGQSGRFTWCFASDGRFSRTTGCAVDLAEGFDGRLAWTIDASGMPSFLELDSLDIARVLHGVLTRRWLDPESSLECAIDRQQSSDQEIAIEVFPREGSLGGHLYLDRRSALPKKLQLGKVYSFLDYRRKHGMTWPTRIEGDLEGETTVWQVETIRPLAPTSDAFRAKPRIERPRPFAGAALDELRELPDGRLLARPRIDDRDVGWFLFDTGAFRTCVFGSTAAALELSTVGRQSQQGVGGTFDGRLFRGKSFRLGPVSFERPVFGELSADDVGRTDSTVPVVGLCGIEVLHRSVMVLDLRAPRIELHDPASFTVDADWQPLIVDKGRLHVQVRFPEQSGLFDLDTGFDGSVIFTDPEATGFACFRGREKVPRSVAGLGGSRKVLRTSIEWIELGGRRQRDVSTLVVRSGDAPFDVSSVLGTIGAGLMRRFRVVIDVPRRRIAFLD